MRLAKNKFLLCVITIILSYLALFIFDKISYGIERSPFKFIKKDGNVDNKVLEQTIQDLYFRKADKIRAKDNVDLSTANFSYSGDVSASFIAVGVTTATLQSQIDVNNSTDMAQFNLEYAIQNSTKAPKVPSVYVCASDSPQNKKDIADYTCTASSAEVQIQQAINYLNGLNPSGGNLIMESGTFGITATSVSDIYVSSNIHIIGNGDVRIVLSMNDDISYGFFELREGAKNVSFENLAFVSRTSKPLANDGFVIGTKYNTPTSGIENIKIINCRFYDCRTSLFNNGSSLGGSAPMSRDIWIVNNKSYWSSTSVLPNSCIAITQTQGVHIIGNTFNHTIQMSYAKDAEISNNIVLSTFTTTQNVWGYYATVCSNVVVSANQCNNLYIGFYLDNIKNITVTGNQAIGNSSTNSTLVNCMNLTDDGNSWNYSDSDFDIMVTTNITQWSWIYSSSNTLWLYANTLNTNINTSSNTAFLLINSLDDRIADVETSSVAWSSNINSLDDRATDLETSSNSVNATLVSYGAAITAVEQSTNGVIIQDGKGIGGAGNTNSVTFGSSVTVIGDISIWNNNLSLLNTNVTHGMTSILPTNQLGSIKPVSTEGGLYIIGISSGDSTGMNLTAVMGITDPTDATPAMIIRSGRKNGTNWNALGSAETVLSIRNYTTDLMTFSGGGNATISNGFLKFADGYGTLWGANTYLAGTAGASGFIGMVVNGGNYKLKLMPDASLQHFGAVNGITSLTVTSGTINGNLSTTGQFGGGVVANTNAAIPDKLGMFVWDTANAKEYVSTGTVVGAWRPLW